MNKLLYVFHTPTPHVPLPPCPSPPLFLLLCLSPGLGADINTVDKWAEHVTAFDEILGNLNKCKLSAVVAVCTIVARFACYLIWSMLLWQPSLDNITPQLYLIVLLAQPRTLSLRLTQWNQRTRNRRGRKRLKMCKNAFLSYTISVINYLHL